MSRPRKTTRSIDVHLMLPEDLYAKVQLLLWSDVENRVPLGALSRFFEIAGRRYLETCKEEEPNGT